MANRISVPKQDAVLPTVRMFQKELDFVKKRAKEANLSLSDYVRQRLIGDNVPLPSSSSNKPKP